MPPATQSSPITAARAAVRESAAARRRLRGRGRERDAELQALLGLLSEAQAPLTAALRSGRLVGRVSRLQAEREASAAVQAERARVRAMLRRDPGGPSRAKAAEPYSHASFRSFVGYVQRQVNELRADFNALPQRDKRGTPEYRAAAVDLLERIDGLSRQLTARRAKARHWAKVPAARGGWGRIEKRHRTTAATSRTLANDLRNLRARAKTAIAVPIKVVWNAPPERKTAAKRRRWSDDEAFAAMLAHAREHHELPTAAVFRNNPALPSYAVVHGHFGGIPAADLREQLQYEATHPDA